jgi:hypothetical protein
MSCIICFENKIETVYVPCGHRVCCIKCSRNLLNDCPICQLPANCIQTFDVHQDDDFEESEKQPTQVVKIPITNMDIIYYFNQCMQTPQNEKNMQMAIKHLCGKIGYRELTPMEPLYPNQTIRYFMEKKNGNVQLSSERFVKSSDNDNIIIDAKRDNMIPRTKQIYTRV